ncbi:hypothetical protein CAPTEDRAFT_228966 [Capitella teleta]|uniref:EF-hand domain-containing protein n=1 Tax=Capitella teleta TaxID=283909 RepID=R7U5X1_CAPTE|nr:hypothetical protein CAPTEDRAFT_228966 [Capitella teleta]|eukprot:ELT99096.1 hypothetical protein CAPTEDRAFT_228966 [Capitella teleta]
MATKRKITCVTLETKFLAIAIADKFGIPPRTLSTWLKNSEKIQAHYRESGALKWSRGKFSEETIKVLREAFKSKDKDNTGTLDQAQLQDCLMLVGLIATDEDIEFLSKHFDDNGDGELQIEELIENIHVINTHIQYREDLMEAFKIFDRKGEGYIRLPSLLKILTAKNFMTPLDARRLITRLVKKYDHNNDGKFNYAEFVEIYASREFEPGMFENLAKLHGK